MKITAGWASGAVRKVSPNINAGHRSRECVVVHYTAGYTASSCVATFEKASGKASAHFVVDVNGAVTQMVSCNDTAWHAGFGVFRGGGQVNARSIGIEIVNPGYHFRSTSGEILNWERKPVLPARLAPFPGMIEARDPWVGSATVLWPLYPEAQLQAVEDIIRACIKAYPSIAEIVGHRDVDTQRRLKVDPGPAFPMPRMRKLVSDRADSDNVGGRRLVVVSPAAPLNVRGGPGTNFDKLDRGPLANGREVLELEVRGPWIRVQVGDGSSGFEGWCYGEYLKPLSV